MLILARLPDTMPQMFSTHCFVNGSQLLEQPRRLIKGDREHTMRGDPPLPLSSKTPKQRFNESGSKLMVVSKTEILALDTKQRLSRRRRRKKPNR